VTTSASTERDVLRIEQPVEQGWTLPAHWYSDEAIAALERERIFARTWQYAGRAEQVAEPGCFFASRAGHIPVAIVRGKDGELRGFVNVCRHRGHPVVSGEGCRETLQCPYHAWTYGLDGSLRRAPRADREKVDLSDIALLPVAVEEWGPFVFVNPDPNAAPFYESLGELPELIASSGVDLDRVRFHSHYEWEIKSNWKIAMENFLECYHCPVAHPGFSKVIDVDPDAYELTVREWFSSQVGRVRPSALNGDGDGYVPRGDVAVAQYHFLWPNTTINIEAGPVNIAIERWVPTGLRTTVEVTDYFFAEDVTEKQVQEVVDFGTQVGIEDQSLCESVQEGLDAGLVKQGRLLLGSEQLIHDFQRKVVASLTS
jgi:phenylpropionate dioxygenase-like ring-hydroxylating dioxygenase large terminal subunit